MTKKEQLYEGKAKKVFATDKKLDKDRFRRDLGGVEDAYAEVMKRLSKHI